MKALFPGPDFDELYGFTALHMAVLGCTNSSIDDVLRANPTLIDETDYTGRTALNWASWRGESEIVESLLPYKPDYNKADDFGHPPIVHAATSSMQCTALLLQANADVQVRNVDQATLLHLVIRSSDSLSHVIEIMKLLVQAGINVNAVNYAGETALMLAESSMVAEHLIGLGANIGARDHSQRNALSRATQRNNHELIAFYLQKRIDHTEKLENYSTFMHLVAKFGDAETIRLLAHGRLQCRDISAMNSAGLTPIQLAMQRQDVDTEWRENFWQFLKSIDRDQPSFEESPLALSPNEATLPENEDAQACNTSELDDSDVEFQDAEEFQV